MIASRDERNKLQILPCLCSLSVVLVHGDIRFGIQIFAILCHRHIQISQVCAAPCNDYNDKNNNNNNKKKNSNNDAFQLMTILGETEVALRKWADESLVKTLTCTACCWQHANAACKARCMCNHMTYAHSTQQFKVGILACCDSESSSSC